MTNWSFPLKNGLLGRCWHHLKAVGNCKICATSSSLQRAKVAKSEVLRELKVEGEDPADSMRTTVRTTEPSIPWWFWPPIVRCAADRWCHSDVVEKKNRKKERLLTRFFTPFSFSWFFSWWCQDVGRWCRHFTRNRSVLHKHKSQTDRQFLWVTVSASSHLFSIVILLGIRR